MTALVVPSVALSSLVMLRDEAERLYPGDLQNQSIFLGRAVRELIGDAATVGPARHLEHAESRP
jgi:hypothetical protein